MNKPFVGDTVENILMAVAALACILLFIKCVYGYLSFIRWALMGD